MPQMLVRVLLVGVLGSLGALARYGLNELFRQAMPGFKFPWNTLAINLAGSLFLGWFLTVAQNRGIISEPWVMAIGTGFVGAFTTFSTFMFESDGMMQDGEWVKFAAYVGGSIFLGLVCVRLGIVLAGGAPKVQ